MVSFQDARDEAMEDDEAMEARSTQCSFGNPSNRTKRVCNKTT